MFLFKMQSNVNFTSRAVNSLAGSILPEGNCIGCHFTPLRKWIVNSSLSLSNSHDSASTGSNSSGLE